MTVTGTPDPRFGFLQLGVFPGEDAGEALSGVSPFGCIVGGSQYRLDVTRGLVSEAGGYRLECYIAARDLATNMAFALGDKAKSGRASVRLVRRAGCAEGPSVHTEVGAASSGGAIPVMVSAGPNPLMGKAPLRVFTNEKAVGGLLIVYDVRGRRVAECRGANGEYEWDGRSANGLPAPSGTYLFVVKSSPNGRRVGAGKIVILR